MATGGEKQPHSAGTAHGAPPKQSPGPALDLFPVLTGMRIMIPHAIVGASSSAHRRRSPNDPVGNAADVPPVPHPHGRPRASGVPTVTSGALLGPSGRCTSNHVPPPPPETDWADLRPDVRGCTVPDRQVAPIGGALRCACGVSQVQCAPCARGPGMWSSEGGGGMGWGSDGPEHPCPPQKKQMPGPLFGVGETQI